MTMSIHDALDGMTQPIKENLGKGVDKLGHALESIRHPFSNIETTRIEDAHMHEVCEAAVKNFFESGKAEEFVEASPMRRMELAHEFYDSIRDEMHVTAKLTFTPMGRNTCGGYTRLLNCIELNSNMYIEKADVNGLLNTIIHESRHAFQHWAVKHPNQVDIPKATLDAWRDNNRHYIPPSYGIKPYRTQPVEADAFAFADSIIRDSYARSTNPMLNRPLFS